MSEDETLDDMPMKSDAVTAILRGGLGNQLFTYHAASYVALAHNTEVIVDSRQVRLGVTDHGSYISEFLLPGVQSQRRALKPSSFSAITNFKSSGIARVISKTYTSSLYVSSTIGFDENLRILEPPVAIDGTFQSYETPTLAWELGASRTLKLRNYSDILKKLVMRSRQEDRLAIHVRRGDYQYFGYDLLEREYYEAAIHSAWEAKGKRIPIWIFTDDTDASMRLMSELKITDFETIEPNLLNPAQVMFLISTCTSIVVANSSFSWWAAAFADAKTQVFAPNPWSSKNCPPEILFPHWTTIPSGWKK